MVVKVVLEKTEPGQIVCKTVYEKVRCGTLTAFGSKRRPHNVLLQQVDRCSKEDDILHQECNVARHRRKSTARFGPSVRNERNDGDGPYERDNRADGAKDSKLLVPETGV